jgi:ADP-ribose pyrophosphatase YjhB (NUDIX family)
VSDEGGLSYGGVVTDYSGQFLLRQPKHHHGGYAWTFPKRKPKIGEKPEQTALQSVLELTGWAAEIIQSIPGTFPGETTENRYFLMHATIQKALPAKSTEEIHWANHKEAHELISQTTTSIGLHRDLQVLESGRMILETLKSVKNDREQGLAPYSHNNIEDEVLITSALRMDGYKFVETTRFDHIAAIREAEETGRFPEDPLQRMAMFFMLQRYLYKWGGESLTKQSRIWWIFRQLYLDTCDTYVPSEFQYHDGDLYYSRWEREQLPSLRQCAEIVRLNHHHTAYFQKDEISPNLSNLTSSQENAPS